MEKWIVTSVSKDHKCRCRPVKFAGFRFYRKIIQLKFENGAPPFWTGLTCLKLPGLKESALVKKCGFVGLDGLEWVTLASRGNTKKSQKMTWQVEYAFS